MGRQILGKAKKRHFPSLVESVVNPTIKKIERVLRESNPRLKNRNLT